MKSLYAAKTIVSALASILGVDPTLATLALEALQSSRICVSGDRVVVQGEYLEGELHVKDPLLAKKLATTLKTCET